MNQRVRRLGVAQLAKVLAALYFLLGTVFAALFALIGSVVPLSEWGGDATPFGMGFLVVMPFLYAIAGFVFGALIAWLYNFVADWTGGVELGLEPAGAD